MTVTGPSFLSTNEQGFLQRLKSKGAWLLWGFGLVLIGQLLTVVYALSCLHRVEALAEEVKQRIAQPEGVTQTTYRLGPQGSPAERVVGKWILSKPQYCELEFSSDGKVACRTGGKSEKGQYVIQGHELVLTFEHKPLFWEGRPHGTKFASFVVTDQQLVLLAPREQQGGILNGPAYIFARAAQ